MKTWDRQEPCKLELEVILRKTTYTITTQNKTFTISKCY